MISSSNSLGASVAVVEVWEIVSTCLFLVGAIILRRKRNPVYWGIFAGSILVCLFDWIWNRNWFGAVTYSDRFIAIWSARGQLEPITLPLVYCFFFGLPLVLILDRRRWLDTHLGRRQWLVLFLAFATPQMPFEILASRVLHLWVYHEVSPWTLVGVPWSNAAFSGLLGVGFYAAGRLAIRWTWPHPANAGTLGRQLEAASHDPTVSPDRVERASALRVVSVISARERWWRAFATTLALSALTLTAITYTFLPWYLIVQPWSPNVPPL